MSAAEWVAALLLLVITVYAWSGMADYGAGLWDLLAGGRERGRAARALIDTALTPIWEANHVWLIFILVVAWTAFGAAFSAIMTTLWVPLCLALLGIVLRGSNFALRKAAARVGTRHLTAYLFGIGSVLTPYCLGAVLGGVAAGQVPPGDYAGDPWGSWWNPVSVAVGLLTVAAGAYLAAAYLMVEARRRDRPELIGYFRRRAAAAGVVGLVLGAVAVVALFGEQREMFDRMVSRGTVLFAVGLLALLATLLLARRAARRPTGPGVPRGMRVAAALGVAGLVWGWGVAQFPYLLPFGLTITEGAGAPVTQRWVLIWAAVAGVVVGPALVLLYVLDQRGALGDESAEHQI